MNPIENGDIPVLLLMAEILHHLGCIKPCKQWDKLPINHYQPVQDFSHQQYVSLRVGFNQLLQRVGRPNTSDPPDGPTSRQEAREVVRDVLEAIALKETCPRRGCKIPSWSRGNPNSDWGGTGTGTGMESRCLF